MVDKVSELVYRQKPSLYNAETDDRIPLMVCPKCSNISFALTADNKFYCLDCETLYEGLDSLR